MLKSSSKEEKANFLLQENKIMRKGLKEMNDFLSEFIDHLKELKLVNLYSMSYKYGNNGKLKKTRDEKLKKLNAESKNYESMLTNLLKEHRKYKNRVNLVTDHRFIIDLRKDVAESNDYIDKLQR